MTSFSPREIVSELDRHIIGQKDAKRAVAVALRNRWRRRQLPDSLKPFWRRANEHSKIGNVNISFFIRYGSNVKKLTMLTS
mgnify:CR=1 FL=1